MVHVHPMYVPHYVLAPLRAQDILYRRTLRMTIQMRYNIHPVIGFVLMKHVLHYTHFKQLCNLFQGCHYRR